MTARLRLLLLGAPSLEFLANGLMRGSGTSYATSKDSNLRSLIRPLASWVVATYYCKGTFWSTCMRRGGDEGLSLTADPKAVGELLTSARATLRSWGRGWYSLLGELALYELPAGLVRPLFYALPRGGDWESTRDKSECGQSSRVEDYSDGGRGSWLLLMNAETSRGWETFVSGASGSCFTGIQCSVFLQTCR